MERIGHAFLLVATGCCLALGTLIAFGVPADELRMQCDVFMQGEL